MSRRTVFIIDDEEMIRKVVSIHLHKADYNVIQSSGGADIFDELQNNDFEVVICDVSMPDVDGIKILKYIIDHFNDIPVLMLTGLVDINIAIDAMKIGASDFLLKPVKREQLCIAIQNAFQKRDLILRNKQLEKENMEYQLFLEKKVTERTKEIHEKAIELEKANNTLKSMNFQMVKVLAEAIEAKDKYTRGHCDRMRSICLILGKSLNLTSLEMTDIEYSAILHDLGKIGIVDSILNKVDTLTKEEFDIIKEHPLIGEKILSEIETLQNVSKIIKHHHENWDGSGYPDGLKGEEIPLLSRIVTVADVFDALTSNRPYRKAISADEALLEIEDIAGIKLDRTIVRFLLDKKDHLCSLVLGAENK